MVKETPMSALKPVLIWRVQIIQMRCCTLAKYQSPPTSVPPGTPGPGGPIERPGDWVEVPVAPGAPPPGLGGSGFFLPFLASSSGSPFRGSSLGGLIHFGGGSSEG